jgi:hypothetical protein
MTGGAALQLPNALNLIFRRQPLADFRLVRGSFPIHVENLIARAENRFRIAMAVQAPMHQKRAGLKDQGHLVNLAVARGAANTFVDVNTVIEIDVVREAMDANPLDRFIGSITFAHRLQVAGVVEEHGMAIHAGLGGGHAGSGGGFNAGMTVTAVDAVIADVMLVAELNGLFAGNVLVRQIGSAGQSHDSAERQGGQQRTKKDTHPGDEVRTAVKNLRHVNFALLR